MEKSTELVKPIEMPPFSVGEKLPLKGHWFTVAKVGLTENVVPGIVLEMGELTAKEAERRERRNRKLGTDNGVAVAEEGVGAEEADNRGQVEGTSPAPDRPRESEVASGLVASSDNSNEGEPHLDESSERGNSNIA